MTPEQLKQYFNQTREQTENLCLPLHKEDYVPQPITDVSPPKWHLAHTSWFFEAFILREFMPDYEDFHPLYNFLFNSYYQNVGDQWDRQQRGFLSRPTTDDVYRFRKAINERMEQAFEQVHESQWESFKELVILGCNHEQQHQELLATDIKYILSMSPVFSAYTRNNPFEKGFENPNYKNQEFLDVEGGLHEVGYEGNGFHMDNEKPVHKVYLNDFKIQNRLVTNGEFLEFLEDGGYDDFNHWLDDGWTELKNGEWDGPLYWRKFDNQWYELTLAGWQPLKLDAPVTHVNFYEAEAYASWAGKRLPTEFEWEVAAKQTSPDVSIGNFVDYGYFHPIPANQPAHSQNLLQQIYGDNWEWTYSSYLPYPGFKPAPGALGEYNGKFMINQMVLRGGSCATPSNHFRISYRNFFPPNKQFQFSGFRLAEDR